jgi:squalene synthase HpnC
MVTASNTLEIPPGILPEGKTNPAREHYENFTVGSIFLPREIKRHVFNFYAYCRVCDDLADETGDPALSTRLLEWWREELHECFNGNPRQPIFVALLETIRQFDLPMEPFEDLISAFMQDQTVTRYETFDQVLDYCKRSANPVGRIFLYLLRQADEHFFDLSDSTCTALQLANFWQDIGIDYQKGRIYIPKEDMERFGYSESELRNKIVNVSFVRLMRFELTRTRELFDRGAALCKMISGVGAADIELFTRGGLSVLRSIEKINYDVFRRRAKVSKLRKLLLMAGWCSGRLLNR